MAGTLVNLSQVYKQRGDYAQARALLLEAEPHHAAVLKANPRNPTFRQFYRSNLWELTLSYAGLLEPAEALRTAQRLCDLGWDPPDTACDAARALAECIPIVERHIKLNADQRKEAMEYYSDKAMAFLQDAVKKKFRDLNKLKQSTAVAPLRQREDFKKLIAEMENQKDKPKSSPEKK